MKGTTSMKPVLTKIAVVFALLMAMTFVIGGTASAQSIMTAHRVGATTPNACPPTIGEGSGGAAVVTLQQALNELYRDFDDPSFFENSPNNFHPPLSVDGSFGALTLAAVKDFQSWNPPLAVDGIVGPQTWHVLHKC